MTLFPDANVLSADMKAFVLATEPRYTNIARPGDLGGVLLDSVAAIFGNDVFVLANDLQARVQLAALNDLGLIPRGRVYASAPIVFTLTAAQPAPYTILQDTEWGAGTLRFRLAADVTIPTGQLNNSAQPGVVECLTPGTVGNVAMGTINQNLNSIAFIASVTNPEQAQGGEDAETESEFLLRSSSEYAQHKMLVRPNDFAKAVENVPGILRASALPITSFTAPSTYTSPAPGKVTVLAMPNDGSLLTTLAKSEILDALSNQEYIDLQANNYLYIADYQRLTVTVVVSVKKQSGKDAQVIAAIKAALSAFIDPKIWQAGRAVNYVEVGAVIDAIPYVDTVESMTLNGGTINLTLTPQTVAQFDLASSVTIV
jgi:Baseplate J-like protein